MLCATIATRRSRMFFAKAFKFVAQPVARPGDRPVVRIVEDQGLHAPAAAGLPKAVETRRRRDSKPCTSRIVRAAGRKSSGRCSPLSFGQLHRDAEIFFDQLAILAAAWRRPADCGTRITSRSSSIWIGKTPDGAGQQQGLALTVGEPMLAVGDKSQRKMRPQPLVALLAEIARGEK